MWLKSKTTLSTSKYVNACKYSTNSNWMSSIAADNVKSTRGKHIIKAGWNSFEKFAIDLEMKEQITNWRFGCSPCDWSNSTVLCPNENQWTLWTEHTDFYEFFWFWNFYRSIAKCLSNHWSMTFQINSLRWQSIWWSSKRC